MSPVEWIIAVLVGLLIVLPVVGWVATGVLVRAARQRPYITFLTDRAVSMALKSVGSSLIAALAINGVLDLVELERPLGTLLVAVAIVLIEIPAALFTVLYLTGQFGDEE